MRLPQHAGVTGKVENCVTWVFAALVTALGQAWVDLDVHAGLLGDGPAAEEEGRDPEKLAFATKPELAIVQAKRLMAAGLRVTWAAADEVYGRCGEFRAALRVLGLSYVVIIPCDYRVTLAENTVIRADEAGGLQIRTSAARRRVAADLSENDSQHPAGHASQPDDHHAVVRMPPPAPPEAVLPSQRWP